MKLSIFNRY